MNDQNEQTVLEWLKANLSLRGVGSLFSRRPIAEEPIAGNINADPEVHPEAQMQPNITTAEQNVKLVGEVTEIVVSDNEAKTAKMAHVVIQADIPKGLTLNITIQTNAEGKASVSSRIFPAQVADVSKSTALAGYYVKLGKLIKRRWQWALVIGALLIFLFTASFPKFGNSDNNGIAGEVVQANIQANGENLELSYSPIDMGQPGDIFDNDFVTLMRGASANPYILNFNFSTPRHLSGIFGQFAMMDYRITVDLYPTNSDSPVRYEFTGEKITTDVELEMTFENAPEQVERVYMEILQLNPGELVHIHVREIKFLP
jgi:hypothetical protein